MQTEISIFKEAAGLDEDNLVFPDVIQNRFGAKFGSYTMLVMKSENDKKTYIPLYVVNNEAEIGICLIELSKDDLKKLTTFIFANFKLVKKIKCEYCINKIDGYARNYPTNQFHLVLPKSTEELWERMSTKSKQTLRRKHKHITNQFNSEPKFLHYSIQDGIPEEVVNVFFTFKKELMNREYGLSSQNYIKKYYVTDAYVWKVISKSQNISDNYLSIVFTCEQGNIVYLENLTYNPAWQKESPGFLLYSKVVEELIKKGKKEFYLGRKYRDYKQKFNSINTLCYDVVVFRSLSIYTCFLLKKMFKKLLRK